jgi:signal transduction histidine kinase/CheY-like chemotaxis protein
MTESVRPSNPQTDDGWRDAGDAVYDGSRGTRFLADSATRLLSQEHTDEVVRQLIADFGSFLDADVHFNYLVNADGKAMHLNCYAGVDESVGQRMHDLNIGESLCGTAAAERRRLIVNDVLLSDDPGVAGIRALGICAYACHPLVAGGRLIGTLAYCTRSRGGFAAEQIDLMRAFSEQIAMALDRARLTSDLQHHVTELAQANAAKDHFLAALSHELRTPLTPVLMAVTALELDDDIPQRLRDDLGMIKRNIELEARLIDDLLDLTRIARGKMQFRFETIDAHEILRRTVEIVRSNITAKKLSLHTDLAAIRHHVRADPARLQQVFWNILKNAVKFTPAGGSIAIRTRTTETHTILVEIIDSGIGIDPHSLTRIFDAFEHSDMAVSRHFGGLGLGLAISKALIDQHGGKLNAFSEGSGRGATFAVEMATTHRPIAKALSSAEISRSGPGLRILLIEDHPATLDVLSKLLRGLGHHVRTAPAVQQALEVAQSEHFDLVISDIGLPDGSGLDLMRELKSRYDLKGIALSGYGTEQDVLSSRRAGFEAHLTKPVSLQQLLTVIGDISGVK